MSHETTQPTLDRTASASSAGNLQALTLIEVAALLAIHRATRDRAPISPSVFLTEALLLILERRHILRRWAEENQCRPEGLQRAIYDPVCWQYLGEWQATPHCEEAIERRLHACACDDGSLHDRLQLWRVLADAEIAGYLSYLLRRHGFEPQWAMDLPSSRWDSGITLAQMRYVVWASVREGAAAFLRTSYDRDHARAVISSAIRRRSQWIAGRSDTGQSFVPPSTARMSIFLALFLNDVAPMGNAYWLVPPTVDALRLSNARFNPRTAGKTDDQVE